MNILFWLLICVLWLGISIWIYLSINKISSFVPELMCMFSEANLVKFIYVYIVGTTCWESVPITHLCTDFDILFPGFVISILSLMNLGLYNNFMNIPCMQFQFSETIKIKLEKDIAKLDILINICFLCLKDIMELAKAQEYQCLSAFFLQCLEMPLYMVIENLWPPS